MLFLGFARTREKNESAFLQSTAMMGTLVDPLTTAAATTQHVFDLKISKSDQMTRRTYATSWYTKTTPALKNIAQ